MPEVALFNNSGQNLTPKKVFFIFIIFIYQKQDTLMVLIGQTSHINTFFMFTFSTTIISMCKISSQNSFYRQSRIFGGLYMLVLTLIFKHLREMQADEVNFYM